MNVKNLIGREEECRVLERCYKSSEPEFVIVYGRRRVGKTFLITEFFDDRFAFRVTGVYKKPKAIQLNNFTEELKKRSGKEYESFETWSQAFWALRDYLDSLPKDKKQILFFDETPWLDNQKSDFLPSFDYFWNNYGNSKNNLMLIVAGSASAWITNKLIKNKGGFFNRHTARLYLQPFTLKETKEYLKRKGARWNNYDIAQAYMVTGGIPFYLKQFDASETISENIDRIYFKKNGPLWDEFSRLYDTLFNGDQKYQEIVKALAEKKRGMKREEISKKTGAPKNGTLTKMLQNLIDSGFITKTESHSDRKTTLYVLTDFYTIFYFDFLKENSGKEEHFWSVTTDLPKRKAWLGLTFELLCKNHINQIKKKLGIEGISSAYYSWEMQGNEFEKGCQIDLVIDRRDNVADLCEIKFSINEFEIDKNYDMTLRNKIARYADENPKSSIQLILITTYGLKRNQYASIVNKTIALNDLFQ